MAGGGARVENTDALLNFKGMLSKFAEEAGVALADAEAEMQRTLVWLETEQLTYWQSQIRKRTEAVGRAKEAVRMKKLYKDSSGRTPSAHDEEKTLAIAQRALAEAEMKFANTRRSIPRLQKEIQLYKGGVQRFATSVQSDIPVAVARLDALVAKVQEYIALSAPVIEVAPGSADSAAPAEATGEMAQGQSDAAANWKTEGQEKKEGNP